MLAAAKVNLALHVTGRRADGYHQLDSLVAFADFGDELALRPAPGLSLSLSGAFAPALADEPPNGNLVLRAVARLGEAVGLVPDLHFSLQKTLPVASGIGGGSSDAAVALRLAASHWGLPTHGPEVRAVARGLGADVPMCLTGATLRATGIGEDITPLPPLPPVGLLLVNPGIAVPTPEVFRRLASRDNPPLGPIPAFADAKALAAYVRVTRNDLEAPAIAFAPVIGDVLAALADLPDVLASRMSGSGATCFALFDDRRAAQRAADALSPSHPTWWVKAGTLH